MFVRNNTTCSSCGKCQTFDIYNSIGLHNHYGDIYTGLALKCIHCNAVISVNVDPFVLFDIIHSAVRTLPRRSMWVKQFVALPQYDDILDKHFMETIEWVTNCAFIRNICDPDLVGHPVLQTFVERLLDRDSIYWEVSYGAAHAFVNRYDYASYSAGQSLAN